jgi:hypothetical protein
LLADIIDKYAQKSFAQNLPGFYQELFNEDGGQQKHITYPTLMAWWATKRHYLPYIDGVVGNKKTLPTLH